MLFKGYCSPKNFMNKVRKEVKITSFFLFKKSSSLFLDTPDLKRFYLILNSIPNFFAFSEISSNMSFNF